MSVADQVCKAFPVLYLTVFRSIYHLMYLLLNFCLDLATLLSVLFLLLCLGWLFLFGSVVVFVFLADKFFEIGYWRIGSIVVEEFLNNLPLRYRAKPFKQQLGILCAKVIFVNPASIGIKYLQPLLLRL